jgi:hypothetical protein
MPTQTTVDASSRLTPVLVPRSATTAMLRRPLLWKNVAFGAGAVAVPAALGLAVGLRSRRNGAIVGGLTALAVAAVRWQLARWFSLQPPYSVERRIGPVELRHYPPRVEARATIHDATFTEALSDGVHRLAEYIRGDNRRTESLDRTAPVIARSETIGLSSPVVTTDDTGAFTVAFVMPPGRTRSTLPRPSDPGIELVQVSSRRVAVMRFRGRCDAESVAAHQRDLMHLVVGAGLTPRGAPSFAGYDAKATLPWLRRNEVMIEVV